MQKDLETKVYMLKLLAEKQMITTIFSVFKIEVLRLSSASGIFLACP